MLLAVGHSSITRKCVWLSLPRQVEPSILPRLERPRAVWEARARVALEGDGEENRIYELEYQLLQPILDDVPWAPRNGEQLQQVDFS